MRLYRLIYLNTWLVKEIVDLKSRSRVILECNGNRKVKNLILFRDAWQYTESLCSGDLLDEWGGVKEKNYDNVEANWNKVEIAYELDEYYPSKYPIMNCNHHIKL